jgi:hypothetical protein
VEALKAEPTTVMSDRAVLAMTGGLMALKPSERRLKRSFATTSNKAFTKRLFTIEELLASELLNT